MSAHRVLIADDVAVRSSLRRLLDHEPDIVVAGEARDGREAVRLALTMELDVVLMDVRMPRMTGLEAVKILSSRPQGPRIIMLTMFDMDEYVYEALRSGASGFLLKNSAPTTVLGAVRAARHGTSLLAPEITARLIGGLAPVRPDARVKTLTVREQETLALIGRGLSNDEIAARLYVTSTTARTYVSRILTKLGARDRAQLVVMAYENGLTRRR